MFRVFPVKYSILIDIGELEKTMSDQRTTAIARGLHRPSKSAQAMTADRVIGRSASVAFAVLPPSGCIFVPSRAQSLARTA